MLKARYIAGDEGLANEFLLRARPLIYNNPPELVRTEVHAMKQRTEAYLRQKGRGWGEVKLGEGTIRDIEFVVQYLQLIYGGNQPEIRSRNTLHALPRLLEYNLLPLEEFRILMEGYTFFRTVEHHLQMMDYRQTYTLPVKTADLNSLARRLGFEDQPNGDQAGNLFLQSYQRHSTAVRSVYLKYLENIKMDDTSFHPSSPEVRRHVSRMDPSYETAFSAADIQRHTLLADSLDHDHLVRVETTPLEDETWRVTIVAFDYPGELSLICGLFFVHGCNIIDGNVFTYEPANSDQAVVKKEQRRKIVDVFTVHMDPQRGGEEIWHQYVEDLEELLRQTHIGHRQEALVQLAKRAARVVPEQTGSATPLYPIRIEIDNHSSEKYTILRIDAMDTIGFLYQLTTALAFNQVYIARVEIDSIGERINDVLYVTDSEGRKITSEQKLRELRTATVLIKHFTHLLPHSPDPQSALLHFREFISQLFRREDWPDELASLERPEVLEALAKVLGVSDFLWQDFLRMQYANLFPVVKDVDALVTAKSRQQLQKELEEALLPVHNGPQPPSEDAPWRSVINSFKDREMFRVDMRHILGHTQEFWDFAEELTDLAEVIVNSAFHLTAEDLRSVYGSPRLEDGAMAEMCVCALGKYGGRELGFASDIELMFIYTGNGHTNGPEKITNSEFFEKVVENFVRSIIAKREGIFEIDLQLRPYGKVGSLAVSLEAFRRYFGPGGATWAYERQALVKLRPVAGDKELGKRVAELRDEFVYTGEPFDVTAMRAMRERQIRHLVKGGTFNPKYSPGGLVDVEYLVQGLQINHGAANPQLRLTNTRAALAALANSGVLSEDDYQRLRKAYTFLRWLIDSLRVVAGNAKDLVVPPENSEQFAFLARRLRYGENAALLREELRRYSSAVQEINRRLLG
jgi:glutamate-ammonia-ligase adenylyltransferase